MFKKYEIFKENRFNFYSQAIKNMKFSKEKRFNFLSSNI